MVHIFIKKSLLNIQKYIFFIEEPLRFVNGIITCFVSLKPDYDLKCDINTTLNNYLLNGINALRLKNYTRNPIIKYLIIRHVLILREWGLYSKVTSNYNFSIGLNSYGF